ncbi:UDP-N-acetylglucosamine 2-epimerase [Salidesulfovibrio brasiliensis]|uniref:UDP-N-acetylglucosamine 2-epimerase n=1 Tax=Salidesulfovibrio brasiliensis TaxID=221711 RepID=UPI0006CFB945|nr:UDP-N-acetylglucosamine 2-epimerase [Salidesulfovibrio brasiliensis]
MRRVCVFTATRAEYGLLRRLMRGVADDPNLHLQVLASGAHLSEAHGMTVSEIERDGFTVDARVPILDDGDTAADICRAMGRGMDGYREALEQLAPDLLVLLGDRYEAFVCAAAATVCRIPVAHIHGGEATFGLFDEPFRHSITKMSHLHFTSTDVYRRRVIQLGEHPDRVVNVGGLGVEAIAHLDLLEREALAPDFRIDLNEPFLLVTFHPVTLEDASAEGQFGELLQAIEESGLNAVFTHANSDTQGSRVNAMIRDAAKRLPERFEEHVSLGQRRYLSLMRLCAAVVGNTSSGLLEAPSLRVPTLDVGDRQKGRVRADSVLHCEQSLAAIRQGVKTVLSEEFRTRAAAVKSPYEGEEPSEVILRTLKSADLEGLLKKEFYDLPA